MTVILQLLMQSAFHHTFFPESVKDVTGSHPQAGRTIASVDLHQAFAKSSEIFLVLLNISVTSPSSRSAVTTAAVFEIGVFL